MTIVVSTNQTSLLKDLPAKYDKVRSALGKVNLPKGGIVTKGSIALALVQTGVIALAGLIANQLNTASVPEVYETPAFQRPAPSSSYKTRSGFRGFSRRYSRRNCRPYKVRRRSRSCSNKSGRNRF